MTNASITSDIDPDRFVGIHFIREQVDQRINSVYLNDVAMWAIQQLDLDRCKTLDRWRFLDSEIALLTDIPCNVIAVEQFLAASSAVKGFREAVRYPSENGKRSIATTKARLQAISPNLNLRFPPNPKAVMPGLWSEIAAAIDRKLALDAGSLEEWQLLNRLLLIEFFAICRLTSAELVKLQLAKLAKPVMSVRGSLTRIPSKIPRPGDSTLTLESMPQVLPTINSTSLLAKATNQVVKDLVSRSGIIHRCCGLEESDALRSLPEKQKAIVIQGRSRDYAMFEANGAILLVSAMAEQAVRSHAERHGVNNTIPNRPIPIATVARQLTNQNYLGQQASTACKDLFEGDRGNVRNRIAHGALVDTEAKYLEALLDHDGEWADLPSIDSDEDHFSPHAVACHVVNLASTIIADIETRGTIIENHTSWTNWFGVADISAHGQALSIA